ncbi:MAG TPA: extracellular solute-binding protein, partial [Armatimonadota bacterium]|nr:extracellular solute-binding protein [Armatimonadota bacterium]
VSLDEPYSRPVLNAFTRETGIAVRPVFDTEANKSRGLAQRILAERGRPRADLFWSSEVMQTLTLKQGGALDAYRSPSAAGIPARYRDPDGFWTGFAARMRVLVYNTGRVKTPPRSLLELTDPKWRGEVAMANPLFGTTTTEAVALFQKLGPERARAYYQARKANRTRMVDGNSVAAEDTARGDARVGQTDTDDAYIRVDQGRPLGVVFPDQDGMGALLIPNTVGLVRGGPHPELAKRFVDYLLRPETEMLLAKLPSRQLPLHESLRGPNESRLPENVRPLARAKAMEVDYNRFLDNYEEVDRFLRDTFLK